MPGKISVIKIHCHFPESRGRGGGWIAGNLSSTCGNSHNVCLSCELLISQSQSIIISNIPFSIGFVAKTPIAKETTKLLTFTHTQIHIQKHTTKQINNNSNKKSSKVNLVKHRKYQQWAQVF